MGIAFISLILRFDTFIVLFCARFSGKLATFCLELAILTYRLVLHYKHLLLCLIGGHVKLNSCAFFDTWPFQVAECFGWERELLHSYSKHWVQFSFSFFLSFTSWHLAFALRKTLDSKIVLKGFFCSNQWSIMMNNLKNMWIYHSLEIAKGKKNRVSFERFLFKDGRVTRTIFCIYFYK